MSEVNFSTDELRAILKAKILRRMDAVAAEFELDLKKMVSVQAKRARSRTGQFRSAVERATPGAPPRRITGRGLTSIKVRAEDTGNLSIDLIAEMLKYMKIHEYRNHPWFYRTFNENRRKYIAILKGDE